MAELKGFNLEADLNLHRSMQFPKHCLALQVDVQRISLHLFGLKSSAPQPVTRALTCTNRTQGYYSRELDPLTIF
jgi:hypothetical protein